MKFTKAQILNFEPFLARFVGFSQQGQQFISNVSDGGLSWGFGRNAVIFKNIFKTIHEELALTNPSEELKAYEEARVKFLTDNEKLSDEEKTVKVDALIDEFNVREELNDRVAKLNEILNEEIEVNAFKINRNKVSGMRDGDDPSKCVLTARDSAYLQDLGLLYDPSDEEVKKD
jgi:hypothetical protein